MKSRLFSGRALAGFGIACAVAISSPVILQAVVGSAAYAEDEAKPGTVRPEIGKPLQEAKKALDAKKYGEALAKLKEADAVGNKSAYEEGLLEQLRLVGAVYGDEPGVAAKSYDFLSNAGTLQPNQKTLFAMAIAGAYMKAKELGQAATWYGKYFAAGGSELSARNAMAQAYFFNNDFANATKAANEGIEAYTRAGQVPSEDIIKLLAASATKQNDKKGYAAALEQLVAYYPKPDYWSDLIHQVAVKPGFPENRLSLDIFRLKSATGGLKDANDYMEYAEQASLAGFPAEAKAVVEQGYKAGVLGTGAETERHGRLKSMAERSVASDQPGLAGAEAEAGKKADGSALVSTGMDYYGYGQYDKAISLIQAGIAKGGLKYPDDAKLHLGIVQIAAGKKADGVATLKSIKGGDADNDLARLWLIKTTGRAA